ncbi:Peroxiredoxin [Dufourea novaeangliae]|uniref:thioredoxin-dependent peroxiredoxin n=1 Tax=Dufourea novaeangliae TaxID=178035 RepID=A0A154PQ06_DUFNO|nr:Peroxiredoxin [Dufourea novaeangliae]
MATLGPYHTEKDSAQNLCCGETPQKSEVPVSQVEPTPQVVPKIFSPAPAWSSTAVIDSKLKKLSLDSYAGKYLIMLFYQYDFSFVCPTEIIQFSDRVEEFQKSGCELVAVSTDSQYSHLAWILTPRKQGGLSEMRIPMVSDKNHAISRSYGVLDENEGVSMKALFVIDKKQFIRHVSISDHCLARSVDESLRIVEGCLFADTYGNVCPMGPREGGLTTKKASDVFSTT